VLYGDAGLTQLCDSSANSLKYTCLLDITNGGNLFIPGPDQLVYDLQSVVSREMLLVKIEVSTNSKKNNTSTLNKIKFELLQGSGALNVVQPIGEKKTSACVSHSQ
jgi:hypothetical protein